jgi:hypothetical protein
MSRLWVNIHFRQDIYNGFSVRLQIGKRVVDDMHTGHHHLILTYVGRNARSISFIQSTLNKAIGICFAALIYIVS